MRRMRQLCKRVFSVLLALLIGVCLAFTGYVPEVRAVGAATEMANLVVFVKMHGADGNVFDEVTDYGTYIEDKWDVIRKMYSGGKSLSDYVSTITCGQVSVSSVFLQEYTRGDGSSGIDVLELSQESYSTDDAMVQEVIQRIQNAKPGTPLYAGGQSLDRNGDGCVDNLTIIVQGDNINGQDHSFKADYGGDERINGLCVRSYNALSSKMLFYKSVYIHEFLHTLGLPDLYSLNGSSDTEIASGPVGMWDVMAAAGSPTPQYVMGYLRKEKGWLDGSSVAEITTDGTYTLSAVNQPDAAGGVRLYTISPTLPQGESQIICLEYRRAMPIGEYDHLLDEGLLMYRVDDTVQDHTNIKGENYIYVYRPECGTVNDVGVSTLGAALNVKNGETSYGSTDLSAPFSDNTLYYSDGSNSGVRISNLRLSADGTEITFDVEFAEYGDNWQALGGTAANDVQSEMSLYADAAGNLYLSYINASAQLCVRRWDQAAGAWQQMGTPLPVDSRSTSAMADCNGQLYLAYLDGSGLPVYSVWNGSEWSGAVQLDTVAYPNSLQLIVDGSGVYAAYQNPLANGKQLVIRNLSNGAVVVDDRTTAQDFCNPTVVKQGEVFYVAYAEFPMGNSRIDAYDTVTKAWSAIYDYGTVGNNVNLLHRQGAKLYGLSGTSGMAPSLAVWDGATWTRTLVPQMSDYFRVSLVTAGETVYLAYLDTATHQARMLRFSEGGFEPCYDGLNGNADEFQAAAIGDQVYVATKTGSAVTVRCQKVEYDPGVTPPLVTPPPLPSLPPLTLSLTPPAGYDNADIYIDGIKYTATKDGNSYTLQLPDAAGKTAVMYYYNERNVPKGMYVWRLGYQGDICTATPLPELQDLLSYHGFSIRVQGYSGLRFKSGIDTQKRAQLLNGGVRGYQLVEYGTLLITGANLQKYPFIKGGEKVGGGRSYWTENGVVNDRIFETVEGRYRFASVVTKLPEQQYATELAFRSYAVLQSADGEQLIIYGPPVARSIYTVAKQVLAAGEFKQGSSGYNYVKSIVDIVEGRN